MLDEHAADHEVIASLLKEIVRRNPMSHLLELKDGRIVSVSHYEEVTPEQLQSTIADLKKDQERINSTLAGLERLAGTAQESVETPVEPAPVDEPEPATEQPAEAPVEAPAEPVVEEAQPAELAPAPEEPQAQPAPVQLQ